MTTSPTCPHRISLATFCHNLHRPDQPTTAATTPGPVCPHGVTLDKFCTELHQEAPR